MDDFKSELPGGTRPSVEGLITFLYYKDMERAARFYGEVMGFELAIDQGWAKVYKVADSACVGIVDEKRGYHKVSPTKPVILTVVVSDTDAWYQHLKGKGIVTLNEPHDVEELKLRAFLLYDPEGYVIEIQEFLS